VRHTCIFVAEDDIPCQALNTVEGRCVAVVEYAREEVDRKEVHGSEN
jgi:hypothetical protein